MQTQFSDTAAGGEELVVGNLELVRKPLRAVAAGGLDLFLVPLYLNLSPARTDKSVCRVEGHRGSRRGICSW